MEEKEENYDERRDKNRKREKNKRQTYTRKREGIDVEKGMKSTGGGRGGRERGRGGKRR